MLKKLIWLIACTLLIGCSAHHRRDHRMFVGPKEVFKTEIKADGSKLFRYSYYFIDATNSNKNAQFRPGGSARGAQQFASRRSSTEQFESNAKKLIRKLENQLEENEYCVDGYIELDIFEEDQQMHFIGECNESATESDRRKFI